MTIKEVSEHFDMTRAAIKKHLNVLEQGKLISVTRHGRERINKLETKGLNTITDWLGYFDQFWDKKLDNLRKAIENNTTENNTRKGD